MGQPSEQSSNVIELSENINREVKSISGSSPLSLPTATSKIVSYYVNKIQGNYSVERAKLDTECAIRLLFIAYNTTPQDQSDIRIKIEKISDALKDAQLGSDHAMHATLISTEKLLRRIQYQFEDWLDVRAPTHDTNQIDIEDLKGYLKNDLITFAEMIKDESIILKSALDESAKSYNTIIEYIQSVSHTSQSLLENKMKDKEKVADQILAMKAKETSLNNLIEELKEDVRKYNKRSEDYEKQALKAEERAFVLAIVQIGAQVLSAALPPIATALAASSSGGASIVASGVANTATHAADTMKEKKDESKNSAELKAARMQEIEEAKGKITRLEADIITLSDDLEELKAESKNREPADSHSDNDDKKESSALNKRITEKQKQLAEKKEERVILTATIASISDALHALDNGLGNVADSLNKQALTLREMQMRLLDKAEEFEKEKRVHTRELDEIRVLLTGSRSKEETLQLTVLSLNVSITALKRAKEIVEELSLFFRSFSAFMDRIIEENKDHIEVFSGFLEQKTLRPTAVSRLINVGDTFFISRQAEWLAIRDICTRFQASFMSNAQLSIKLTGTYLHSEELRRYLTTVPAELQKIIDERKAASTAKIEEIQGYRNNIQDGLK